MGSQKTHVLGLSFFRSQVGKLWSHSQLLVLAAGFCAGDEEASFEILEVNSFHGFRLGSKSSTASVSCWLLASVEILTIHAFIPITKSDGIELLGAPIGDTEFCDSVRLKFWQTPPNALKIYIFWMNHSPPLASLVLASLISS